MQSKKVSPRFIPPKVQKIDKEPLTDPSPTAFDKYENNEQIVEKETVESLELDLVPNMLEEIPSDYVSEESTEQTARVDNALLQ